MSAQTNVPRVKGAASDRSAAKRSAPARVTTTSSLDYSLIAILATLLGLGLVEVYSASFVRFGAQYFVTQIGWVALGIALMVAMVLIPYRFWQRMAVPLMVVTLLLLVLVLLVGRDVYGARRTLLGGRLQPSEMTKLVVVIYVAAWVASKKKTLKDVRAGLVPFAIVMGIIGGLVVLEKSFSVTIIILVTGVTIFFLGGGDIKQLLVTGIIAAVVLLVLIWEFHYGVVRIQDWWKALIDPDNAPYTVAQVHDIIRRGGGIGTRPENWLQKSYVPLLWSDYLFANLVADFKFVGAMGVLVLFAALGYRGLSIALNAPDQFGALVAIGVTTWLLAQAAIHMGTSVALIPATGIPLPFMSYGGSAMVACMAGAGLLLNVSRASPEKKSAYALFSFGWWNRGTRVSDSRRSGGTTPSGRSSTAPAGRSEGTRAAGTKKSSTLRKYATGYTINEDIDDDGDGAVDWRARAGQPARRQRSIFGKPHRRT
jgi:cell division protein FtsW